MDTPDRGGWKDRVKGVSLTLFSTFEIAKPIRTSRL